MTSSLRYELDPEETALVFDAGAPDALVELLEVCWDGEELDIVASGGAGLVSRMCGIPTAVMDQLAIDWLKARGVKVATVVTWINPDGADTEVFHDHTELIEQVHVDMGWLENEPEQCPLCYEELQRAPGIQRYQVIENQRMVWNPDTGDFERTLIKERVFNGVEPGELLPCPGCGFDWMKDRDNEDLIVVRCLHRLAIERAKEKETANAAAGN